MYFLKYILLYLFALFLLIKNSYSTTPINLELIKEYSIHHKDPDALNEINLLMGILQNKVGDLKIIEEFILKHPLLANALYSKFDKFIDPNIEEEVLQRFLKIIPHKTLLNKMIQLDLNLRRQSSNQDNSFKELQHIWSNHIFGDKIEEFIIQKYGSRFSSDSMALKVRILIMAKRITVANSLVKFISNKYRADYSLLINNIGDTNTLQKLMKNPSLRIKEMATYFYIKNLIKSNNNQYITNLLITTHNAEFASNWWYLRSVAIRDAIRHRKYDVALRLADHNKGLRGEDLFDNHWLLGFINYRLLNKPDKAIEHFIRMKDIAKTSYSKSQGCYWLARAYKDLGKSKESTYWFEFTAKKYPNYFYGQLAALELSQNIVYPTSTDKKLSKEVQAKITKLFLFADALYRNGLLGDANQIINYLTSFHLMPEEVIKIINSKSGKQAIPVFILFSKYLCNKGHPIIPASYPTEIDFSLSDIHYDKALYLSIIRQESSFDRKAISPAKAKGLMQLIPDTERYYANKLGVKNEEYDLEKYHVKLGTFYLDTKMETWDQRYVSAIASYNAGDEFIKRYIDEHGNPKKLKNLYQVLDWIEKISYKETRMYVKKIIENIINYQVIVFKKHSPKQIILPLFNVTKVS